MVRQVDEYGIVIVSCSTSAPLLLYQSVNQPTSSSLPFFTFDFEHIFNDNPGFLSAHILAGERKIT